MAHVQWCVGNTTLREAARLKDGLRILRDNFNGKPWSYENQKHFLALLQKEGDFEAGDAKSDKQIEQHGRIWSSAFNELGFATCYKKGNKHVSGGVIVTEAGNALLSDDYVEEDVWLRQLLKVQFPNSLPQKSKTQFPAFKLLPFQATLKIIHDCDGISKDEGFLINTIRTMSEIDSTINAIKKYRNDINKLRDQGKDKMRQFIMEQQFDKVKILYKKEIEERLGYIKKFYLSKSQAQDIHLLNMIVKGGKGAKTSGAINLSNELKQRKGANAGLKQLESRFLLYYLILKSSSWKDYIDATVRYFRMCGLLTVRKSRITISDEHKDIIKWILEQKWDLKDNGEYLSYLHNHKLPVLPHDKADYLKQKSEETLESVKNLSKSVQVDIEPKVTKIDKDETDPLILRKQLLRLSETRRDLKEYEYMLLLHKGANSIDEIIEYFSSIKKNEILGYAPTHFEWNVWRGFLAIDRLSKFPHKCRNFTIDDELQPVSHAPGGKPDMVFYYDDFILVVEVTLNTGERQYNAEHEPVPRHVIRVIENEKGKDVYSLFIAPGININTAVHFYAKMTSVPHITKDGEVYPRIIPISLDDYISLLRDFQSKKYTPNKLKNLLDDIINLKNDPGIKNGSIWFGRIKGCIDAWSKKL